MSSADRTCKDKTYEKVALAVFISVDTLLKHTKASVGSVFSFGCKSMLMGMRQPQTCTLIDKIH